MQPANSSLTYVRVLLCTRKQHNRLIFFSYSLHQALFSVWQFKKHQLQLQESVKKVAVHKHCHAYFPALSNPAQKAKELKTKNILSNKNFKSNPTYNPLLKSQYNIYWSPLPLNQLKHVFISLLSLIHYPLLVFI